jgi:hypothetical protein
MNRRGLSARTHGTRPHGHTPRICHTAASCVSPILRTGSAQRTHECVDLLTAIATALTSARCRLIHKTHTSKMCRARPDRSGDKTSTAIGAHIVQQRLDAAAVKSALVTADTSLVRVRRQIFIAGLKVRSQLQHESIPPHVFDNANVSGHVHRPSACREIR